MSGEFLRIPVTWSRYSYGPDRVCSCCIRQDQPAADSDKQLLPAQGAGGATNGHCGRGQYLQDLDSKEADGPLSIAQAHSPLAED